MAKMLHKDIGDLWSEPQATFTVGGSATDPTNLTVVQQEPDGTETTLLNNVSVATLTTSSTPIKKVSVGVFQPNPGITLDASGYWFLRFAGTGAVTAAEEHLVAVDPSEFTSDGGVSSRALVTLTEAKQRLQQEQISTVKDLELVNVINGVSHRIHAEADREFKGVTTTATSRTFTIDDAAAYCGIVEVGDMAAAPSQVRVLADDWSTVVETLSSTDWINMPELRQDWQPIQRLQVNYRLASPFRSGYRLEVTSTWGFPSVPPDIKLAALDAIAAAFQQDVENYRTNLAPTPSTPEAGTTIVIGGSQRILSLPPSVLATAWWYRDADAA